MTTPDRAALMHRLTYHAAGLSDRALRLLVLMAELSAEHEAPRSSLRHDVPKERDTD